MLLQFKSIRVFVIAKILSHSSACYSPILVQKTQLRLINSIAGDIRHRGFFKEPLHPIPESIRSGLADIISPVVLLDPSVSKERSNKRKLEKAMWTKEKKITREKYLIRQIYSGFLMQVIVRRHGVQRNRDRG